MHKSLVTPPRDGESITEGWESITEGWESITEGWESITEGWESITEGWVSITEGCCDKGCPSLRDVVIRDVHH